MLKDPITSTIIIEKIIHNQITHSLRSNYDKWADENLNDDLFQKEFFAVPSIRYAILFVEELLDQTDLILKQQELQNLP